MDTRLPNCHPSGKDPEVPLILTISSQKKIIRHSRGPALLTAGETEAPAQAQTQYSPSFPPGGGGGVQGRFKNEKRPKDHPVSASPCTPSASLIQSPPTAYQFNIWGATRTPPPTAIRIFLEMDPSGIPGVGGCAKHPPCVHGPLSLTLGQMGALCPPSSHRGIRFSKAPPFFFGDGWI